MEKRAEKVADVLSGRRLLSPRDSLWRLPGRLVWRQIRTNQDHRSSLCLGYCWCNSAMLRAKCELDVLWYVGSDYLAVLAHFTPARVLNGIGTGILNAITPVWATETAEHTSRGQFVSIEFTLNIFGVVVAYWLE